jgi:hypothetical protein
MVMRGEFIKESAGTSPDDGEFARMTVTAIAWGEMGTGEHLRTVSTVPTADPVLGL